MAKIRAAGNSGRGAERAVRVLSAIADLALTNTIDLTLRHGNYARRSVSSVADARTAIADWRPDLILVDIDLEAGAAIQLIDEARADRPIGVIALTRRSDLRGKLDAFERGADDYIGVPFVPDDLVARTRAVIRRTHGTAGELVPRLRIGDLEIDVLNRKVLAGDHELHLTSLEQALLYLLAANAGSVLTREQILDALWGTDFVIESNVVDRHVRALRAKLQNDWHKPRYIETVSGAGYRFVPDRDDAPPA
ncbi:MAG TPA: response regulator transcription factor [Candidatus Limnocylindria bacterium]|nr:response regulator transcription factor [Candidatus Limnocylindria bacterium]